MNVGSFIAIQHAAIVHIHLHNLLPGLYLSAQLKKSPCLHAVSSPHLSFVTTVDRTGLSLYNLMASENASCNTHF